MKTTLTKRTEERKRDHLEICTNEDVQARQITTGFEDLCLLHKSLPEINQKKIDLSTKVFNHRFSAPLIVESMTGGTNKATEINAAIAQAIEELSLGMGIGSQRAALENPKLEKTFTIVRKEAPSAFIVANIGAPQLTAGYGIRKAEKLVEMVEADALSIHLNPLQEVVQPEGETRFAGVLSAIEKLVNGLNVPIIVKETGCGIAATEAKQLEDAGIAAIDVAGAGGTSWAAVEYHRAKSREDEFRQEIGKTYWDWGIPTVASLVEATQRVRIPVIASGGIRSGLDVAKALVLGSCLTGMATPFLDPAIRGVEAVKKKLHLILEELRIAMFLIGADSIVRLGDMPIIVTGKTAEWLTLRGFDITTYARRGL